MKTKVNTSPTPEIMKDIEEIQTPDIMKHLAEIMNKKDSMDLIFYLKRISRIIENQISFREQVRFLDEMKEIGIYDEEFEA